MEIKLEDESRSMSVATTVEKVSSVGKTFRDTPPKDETGLVVTDKPRDEGLRSIGEDLG